MKKYKTLKEEWDEDWTKIDERHRKNLWPMETKVVGEYLQVPTDKYISLYDFCVTSVINLFHKEDMAKILLNLKVLHYINFWNKLGKEHQCQITIYGRKKHYVEVTSSGYTSTDSISFSKRFPDKLKFQICREMARVCIFKEIEMSKDNDTSKEETLKTLIHSHARCYDDLVNIARIFHLKKSKKFYDKYGIGEQDRDTVKKYEEDRKKFIKDWSTLLKSKFYKLYQKVQQEEIEDAI